MTEPSPRNATPAVIASVAKRLIEDHASGTRFTPFAAASGIRNLSDAYAAQQALVSLMQSRKGARTAGYKIGLTSRKMQAMCGIESPIAGVILSDRVLSSPARLVGADYGRLGLEFEIAVRMGRNLVRGRDGFTAAEIEDAVDSVCAAVEIVDDRGSEYEALDVLSLVADNSWNAGIILGTFRRPWPDLGDLEGVVTADGVEIGRGLGRDVLGHPFVPLRWLADHLASRDEILRAGDIVMTGSIVRTQFPTRPTAYRFDLAGLGAVTCQVDL